MTEIKIDKNVPLPQNSRKARFPLVKKMKVGDSFFSDDTMLLRNPGSYCRSFLQMTGGKFAYRSEGKGVRVWRVE